MALSRVFRNAGMASTQVLVSGGILFVLFYYLIRTIGANDLGIWSVVLATSSTARLSQLGLSGGVVRFVAKYIARKDADRASAVIQTATISIACLMTIILVALYPIFLVLLRYFLPAESYVTGLSLVPFALISLWLGALSGVFASGLDGVLRTDVRSLIVMGSATLHLALVVSFVPNYGLLGLAYAQVIQSLFVLILSWSMLRRYLISLPIIPYRWNRNLFREMLKYGLNIQAASISQMLFDPTSKLLMSKFGGLEFVAFFEMANRMVQQFRSLVVSANQVLVPIFSSMYETTPDRIGSMYRDSFSLFLFMALPIFSGVIAMTPIVSVLWIGTYEVSFVSFSVILAIGWFLNTLSAPAYFANMGTGHLSWNTAAHVSMGILNALLGTVLGMKFGAAGVAVGFVVALVIGSGLVVVSYHKENKVQMTELVPSEHKLMFLVCLFMPFIIWSLYRFLYGQLGVVAIAAICLALVMGIFTIVAWKHPLRRTLMSSIFAGDSEIL